MIKKEYQKPTMRVVKIQQTQIICGSLTDVTTTGLDDDLGYDDNGGNGGNQVNAWARKHNGAWDDEEW